MNVQRWPLRFLLAGTLALLMAVQTYAAEDVRVLYNNEMVHFEVAPIIRDDRTFVPVRFVLERIEAKVGWDGERREVTIEQGDNRVVLTIGSKLVSVNGSISQIDVAPFLHNDRTMVPLRFVSEVFGFQVGWDGTTRTVSLTPPTLTRTVSFGPIGSGDQTGVVVGGQQSVNGTAIVVEAPPSVKVGEEFLVTVRVTKVTDVKGTYSLLRYDSRLVEPTLIISGRLVEGLTIVKEVDTVRSAVKYGTATPGTDSFTGSGLLYSVRFRAIADGSFTIPWSLGFWEIRF